MGVTVESAEPRILKAWTIEALSLSILDAVDLLLALNETAPLGTAQLGSDVLFWRTAALYALSLIAGQEVIPALERQGFQLHAFWKAAPSQPEQALTLSHLMPPISRAIVDDPAAAMGAFALLDRFTNAVIEAP